MIKTQKNNLNTESIKSEINKINSKVSIIPNHNNDSLLPKINKESNQPTIKNHINPNTKINVNIDNSVSAFAKKFIKNNIVTKVNRLDD